MNFRWDITPTIMCNVYLNIQARADSGKLLQLDLPRARGGKGICSSNDNGRRETFTLCLPIQHITLIHEMALKVKGRYLNLQEGKLETTEKMYKHHVMQVIIRL